MNESGMPLILNEELSFNFYLGAGDDVFNNARIE